MINTPHVDWFAISTILVLLGASFVALLGAVLVPASARRAFALSVSVLGFAGGLVTSIWLYVASADGHLVVAGAFYRDRWTMLSQIILCGIGLATSLVAAEHVARPRDEHISEFFALLLASVAGMTAFVGSGNLMIMFLALEWFSIALYVMCAIDYDVEGSLEAGLKYLIIGSFGSAALLFGSALVYGATGRIGFADIAHTVGSRGLSGDGLLVLGLAMIIAGLGFKMSAAPFHMWTPDVYEGAPTTVTAFMSAATKVAAFALAFRLLRTAFPQEEHLWSWAFAGVAVASLAIGNLAALVQRNLKRMLAYSSVSHAGFLLIGLSAGSALGGRALMYYLIVYAAMAFGSFAVLRRTRARARGAGDARQSRRLRLGAALPRHRDVVLPLRFRRSAARRRLRREVLRPLRRVPARLVVARRRRRGRDARVALLLPRRGAGDVHAPERRAAPGRRGRRLTAARTAPARGGRPRARGLGRIALRGRAVIDLAKHAVASLPF